MPVIPVISSLDINTDEDDIGWKIFAGYSFNQYLGLEFAYIDLGEIDTESTSISAITIPVPPSSTFTTNSTTNETIDFSGFSFSGRLRYPVSDKFDIFAKVGGFAWEVDTEITALAEFTITPPPLLPSPNPPPFTLSQSDKGVDWLFGIGLEYEISDHLKIRGEWERYNINFEQGDIGITRKVDVDLFTLGLSYDFNL